ncbi:hypothetical protein POSPLADRAFT_1112376, partial [Postia placenta MAD-698-R-SB12]
MDGLLCVDAGVVARTDRMISYTDAHVKPSIETRTERGNHLLNRAGRAQASSVSLPTRHIDDAGNLPSPLASQSALRLAPISISALSRRVRPLTAADSRDCLPPPLSPRGVHKRTSAQGASPKWQVPPLESPSISRAVLASPLARASRRHSRRVQDTTRRAARAPRKAVLPNEASLARVSVLHPSSPCQSNSHRFRSTQIVWCAIPRRQALPPCVGQQASARPVTRLPLTHRSHSIPSVLHVASGDTVSFDCLDASNGQLTPTSDLAALAALDFARLDQVNGPVHVADARPGDTLRVDVLDVRAADWGWTALIPGFGLLADEFPAPALKLWTLPGAEGGAGRAYAWFDEARGIRVPLRPFAGEMGVAPAQRGDDPAVQDWREHRHEARHGRRDALPARGGRGRAVLHRGWACRAGRWR